MSSLKRNLIFGKDPGDLLAPSAKISAETRALDPQGRSVGHRDFQFLFFAMSAFTFATFMPHFFLPLHFPSHIRQRAWQAETRLRPVIAAEGPRLDGALGFEPHS